MTTITSATPTRLSDADIRDLAYRLVCIAEDATMDEHMDLHGIASLFDTPGPDIGNTDERKAEASRQAYGIADLFSINGRTAWLVEQAEHLTLDMFQLPSRVE